MKKFVEVHYYVRDGKREEFLNKLMSSGIVAASRAEEGNEKYEYFFGSEDENELLLLEIWSSAEAVRLHGETAHFKALGELKAEYVEKTVINRFDIADSE